MDNEAVHLHPADPLAPTHLRHSMRARSGARLGRGHIVHGGRAAASGPLPRAALTTARADAPSPETLRKTAAGVGDELDSSGCDMWRPTDVRPPSRANTPPSRHDGPRLTTSARASSAASLPLHLTTPPTLSAMPKPRCHDTAPTEPSSLPCRRTCKARLDTSPPRRSHFKSSRTGNSARETKPLATDGGPGGGEEPLNFSHANHHEIERNGPTHVFCSGEAAAVQSGCLRPTSAPRRARARAHVARRASSRVSSLGGRGARTRTATETRQREEGPLQTQPAGQGSMPRQS